MKIIGDVAHFAQNMYVCLIQEGERFIPIDELEIGKEYPITMEKMFDMKAEQTTQTAKLIAESKRPNANLYLEIVIEGETHFAKVAGDITIFNKIKQAGLGTIFITNRPFNIAKDQIRIKGMLYDSVERANPKIKDMLPNTVLSDDGFWCTLNEEDYEDHLHYLNECVTYKHTGEE